MDNGEVENEPFGPDPFPIKDPATLSAYKGKIVALVDGEIRASADTASDCVRAIRALGISLESVIFMGVPRTRFVG